jgi:hypothetical protein
MFHADAGRGNMVRMKNTSDAARRTGAGKNVLATGDEPQ